MADAKTTFFGSMYSFEQSGVDDVVHEFRDAYGENPDDAPFINYDKKNHLFKLDKLDLNDEDTPLALLGIMKLYTEEQASRTDHFDVRIQPLEGFLSRLPAEQTDDQQPPLVDTGVIDGDESAENALQAIQHTLTQWRPENGTTKMLTTSIAESIAKKTNTGLQPDHNQNQVLITHGDFDDALQRLRNLEPLMRLRQQQRERAEDQTDNNVLITVDQARRPLLGFQKVSFPGCPGFSRIIVPQQHAPSLSEKLVCEARVIKDEGTRGPHPNIVPDDKASHPTQGLFSLWSDMEYNAVGDESNMYPRGKGSSTAQSHSDVTMAKSKKQKYLDPNKAADVAGWADQIDNNVDPNAVVPEAPEEPVTKRRRHVAVDSDDEDEGADELVGAKQQVVTDSPPPAEPKRRLLVAPDSDDESDRTATQSQTHLEVAEDFAASELYEQPSAEDAQSMAAGRLLSDISEQKPRSRAPSGMQYSDLLRDENAGFEFDAEMPAEFAKHFSIAENENSAPDPSPTQPSNVQSGYAAPAKSRYTSSQGRGKSSMGVLRGGGAGFTTEGHVGISAWGAPIKKPSKPLTLSELSFSDLPQNNAEEVLSPQAPNIMDEYDPLDSPRLTYSNLVGSPTDTGYVPDSSTSGVGRQPMSSVSESHVNRNDIYIAQPRPEESKFYENHQPYKGRDLGLLRQQALETLQTGRDPTEVDDESDQVSKQNEWTTVPGSKQQKGGRGSSQRRGAPQRGQGKRGAGRQRKAIETDRPKYHSTMSQKAPNPGKKGKSKQQGSVAADKTRRQAALNEAYGAIPKSAAPVKPTTGPQLSDMSNKKKAATFKDGSMTISNPHAAQGQYRFKEAEALKVRLQPIFEACRAFNGELDFGIHFGQVLLSADPTTDKAKGFDNKSWEGIFGPDSRANTPLSSFTNILTANGAEMDRLLEARSSESVSGKMFDKYEPGRSSVTYEFSCHSKDGESFVLVLKEDMSYSIQSTDETIGSVAMQCPARVWDASARLQGVERWDDVPEEIEQTVEAFLENVYIAAGDRLVIYFRQPAGNVLTINNPRMKRVSLHQCLVPRFENYQLRITEVKILHTRNSPDDRKLWKAQEDLYDQAFRDGTLHYEACLIDKTINSALEANLELEVGDLTDATTTGKALIKGNRLHPMIELAVTILNKIDYIGFHNTGTMQRLRQALYLQEQSLPPTLRTQLRPLIPASHLPRGAHHQGGSISIPPGLGSVQLPSDLGSEILKPINGIRMNTRAEVVADSEGNLYQRGLGGAMVPVSFQRGDLPSISEVPIEPGDSASQYGAAMKRNVVGRTRGGGNVGGNGLRGLESWMKPDDKEPGFW